MIMINRRNKKARLIIIGASGHGKVVADIASLNGYQDIVFLDDNEMIHTCGAHPVIGKTDKIDSMDGEVFVAIGNVGIREKIMNQYRDRTFPVLIHPNAVIVDDIMIGDGSVVMAGAVINPDAEIGRGVIVNTCSSIDHDCIVGDYVHIAVGAHVCGTVSIGERSWIGAGAIVSNNVNICKDCIVGAGTVVIKDILYTGTYVGVPAFKI